MAQGDDEVPRVQGRKMNKIAMSCSALAVVGLVAVVPQGPIGAGPERGGAGPPDGASGPTVPVCHVPTHESDRAETLHLPQQAVDALIRRSLSYPGPCAEYGQSAHRGDGTLTSYSQVDADGAPVAIGMAMSEETLQGLPYDPPTAGLWCYDKDDDGALDEMTECTGGYEDALHLGEEFRDEVDTPFEYVLMNWNPKGHMPPGVYDRPHFDVHFYMTPNQERVAIRPGPCNVLVHCDDYEKGKDLPDERYLHPDFADLDAVEPAMGNHLTDLTSPEHHGEEFTHTFIYGVWDDEVTFYEPMVTHALYSGLVDGTVDEACHEIKQPAAWQESGWYPTEYCMRYRANREELTTTLEAFEYRKAG